MQSGHTDFGQPGYPAAAYGYAPTLTSLPNNTGHDMNKQVAAAQPNMFSNSGGMSTHTQQHHQSAMSGPVPSPQSAIMQQGQQINRGATNIMPFFRQQVTTRTMPPNMSRAQLTSVVNQTGQQPSSQYGHTMHMVPNATYQHQMQPMLVNQFPQLYPAPRAAYNHQQNYIIPSQLQYVNNWSGFTNQPPPNTNGYFTQHTTMAPFNASMPPQMPQQQPVQAPQPQLRKKNLLSITDPKTGKSIFESNADESGQRSSAEKESENANPDICAQFAAKVAATLTSNKNESLPKSSIDETRMIDSQSVLCPAEIDSMRIEDTEGSELGDVESSGELADTESLGDIECIENRSIPGGEEPAMVYYKDDSSSINECLYDSEKVIPQIVDSIPVTELRDPKVFEMVSEETSCTEKEELLKNDVISEQDTTPILENPVGIIQLQEVEKVNIHVEPEPSPIVHEVVTPADIVNEEEALISENSSEALETNAPGAVSFKIPEKLVSNESKKNKTKKNKKDLNKRGESKEGGEMDAFLDTREEVTPVTSAEPETPSVPTPVERMPSPVPIVDEQILSTIPLPGETIDSFPANDISPSEPISENVSVSPSAESEDKENVVEETQNKITLKYNYKDDQWSPLNPERKKQYDREFLLQMQSQPMSLCKPANLPNLDVIKDKAHIHRLTEINRVVPPMMPPQIRAYNDPFMPNYARGGGGAMRMVHPPVNRRSQGRAEKPRKVISFSNSLTQNIKLHESENAWKPMYKVEASGGNMEELEKEKLKRSVQGVLNKLTPQKFDTLLTQLKNLNIDTEEKLNVVIDLIFEKAIDEPNFSVPYANLCKHLALIKVPLAGQTGQQVNFRKLLLTKCQKEFEQDRSDELKHEERMKAIESAEPDKKKEMKLEYDEEEKKIRYRQLGNIRFIGELFKFGMLIEPIMHECIKKLLTQGDEESLECLCRLLKTIGKELDEGKQTNKNPRESSMDMCFAQMQGIVDKRLTSARVRFMLQDVIDLKKMNWVPRRDENNPKTIDQIHKEAEREAREQQQQVYQNMPSYPNKRVPDERDRRKAAGRTLGQTEDGWTSSTKSNKGSYSVVDPTKLKLTKPDEVDSIRLGPGIRGLQSWGRGSSGGNKTTAESEKTALTNRYSALSEQSLTTTYEARRGSQRSAASSRESSRGRSNQLPPAVRKTASTSKEREKLLETVKGLARANETKVSDSKKNVDVHVNGKSVESEELLLRGPEYSEEDMEKKTKPIIDEFLHNNDFEEAIKCVTELASPVTVHMFILAAINQVLERSSQARYSLGQLLFSLLKKKIISFEQYKKGFASILEIIDDYVLDIPLIWQYMGEILEPIIEDDEYPFQVLKEIVHPCIPSETAGLLVSAILHHAAKRKSTIKLGEMWRESGLQWTDFLGTDLNVNEFIQKHKLEFTISPTKVKPSTQMTIEEISKNLMSLLKKTEENEEIFDWIDANVSETTEPNFIRALVTAVHENVISGEGARCELDQARLKNRSSLLTRYIDHNEKLELQALYAVQFLMNTLGQPNGLLRQIFDILYDDDVITEETFKQWEQSDDPNEAEGKGVAVHSVKSFFTWLKEAESADDEAD